MATLRNSLEVLFGSKERWRLIKTFIFNDGFKFTATEIAKKSRISPAKVKNIILQMEKSGFLGSEIEPKEKTKFYFVDKDFPFFFELKSLVVKSNIFPQCESLEKIEDLGFIKLALITGIFLNDNRAKADLFIVGDDISKDKFKQFIDELEAETGREINYSTLTFSEFKYRLNMFDRFVMEILEAPHQILVNKIGKELNQAKDVRKK